MEFEVGDLVRVTGLHPLTRYTGRVVGIYEDLQECFIRLNQTGLVHGFAAPELELIERSKAHGAN